MQKYFYFQRISLFYFKCRVILKKFFTSPFFTSFCYHASLLHKSRLPSIQFTKQWIPQVKMPLDFPYTTKYRKYLCSISPRLFQGEKCLSVCNLETESLCKFMVSVILTLEVNKRSKVQVISFSGSQGKSVAYIPTLVPFLVTISYNTT